MKALIVDNSLQSFQHASTLLRARGFAVAHSLNRREALSTLRASPGSVELVLASTQSPDYDGLEILAEFKRQAAFAKTQLILVGSAGDTDTERRATEAGAACFITKPLTPAKVGQALAKLLPGQKLYFKEAGYAREEIGLDAETHLELLTDFYRQVSSLIEKFGGDLAPSSKPGDILTLKDGSLLLGTEDMLDLVNRQSGAAFDRESALAELRVVSQQLQAFLPKAKEAPKPPAGAKKDEKGGKKPLSAAELAAKEQERLRAASENLHAALDQAKPTPLVETETLRDSLLQAAANGDHDKQYILGMAYLRGDGFEHDLSKAIQWLTQAAHHKHPLALCQMGLLKLEAAKDNYSPEWTQAYQLLGAAAKLGCRDAEFWSHLMHQGYNTDGKFGASIPHRAAAGEKEAQFLLGVLYDRGGDVTLNATEAVYWLSRSAESGYAPAQYRLGLMYESGRAGKDNQVMSLQWFEQAAQKGMVDAQLACGLIYEKGSLVEQDLGLATIWFRKAAEQGDPRAQYYLGKLLLDSSEDDESMIDAAKWVFLSAMRDYGPAKPLVEQVRARLNPYQAGRVKMGVDTFLKIPGAGPKVAPVKPAMGGKPAAEAAKDAAEPPKAQPTAAQQASDGGAS